MYLSESPDVPKKSLDVMFMKLYVAGEQWAVVSESCWDDVMVKGKPKRVKVSIRLEGKAYWIG